MGITRLYEELSKRHLNPQRVDVKEIIQRPNTTFDVDLFGAFYTTVFDKITEEYFREGERQGQPGYQAPPPGRQAQRAGYALAGIIKHIFGILQSITIHIDGARCLEKGKAHATRDKTRRTALERLIALQTKMDEKSSRGQFSSKSRIGGIKKCLWQLFRLTTTDERFMVDAMKAQGCTVCECMTESDFCIGKMTDIEGWTRYVVSGDSDVLIYRGIRRVLRPVPKPRGEYLLYTKEAVMDALEFPTAAHLTLYGIVSDNDYTDNIPDIGLKEDFLDELFGTGHYYEVGLQECNPLPRRALRTSFHTNGLTMTLLAYDTSRLRLRQAAQAQTGDQIGDGANSEDDIDGGDQVAYQDVDVPDEPFVEALGGGFTINWLQKSGSLENVQTKYNRPNSVPPDPIIIGIDSGVKYSITAAKIDPNAPDNRQIVQITRRFLNKPNADFKRKLERRKTAAGITAIESTTPPFSRSTFQEYFNHMNAVTDGQKNIERLWAFYNQQWFRKHKWESKKAQHACLDYGAEAVLRVTGGYIGAPRDTTNNVVICVELASFSGGVKTSSRHGPLIRRLVDKAKSLHYEIVGCHEYYTSAKCPRPNCNNFLENAPSAAWKVQTELDDDRYERHSISGHPEPARTRWSLFALDIAMQA
ncbi:MAG: hypothetical protein J3Q66DRAFT_442073 [Benniella sp.]|nr:MAG: hypothetical protein J3Q66DRAFT_442073 [Benniella sp.]